MSLRVLDLFCGAGGFSYGFSQAVKGRYLAIDKDPIALTTFRHNSPEKIILQRDINDLHSDEIVKILGGTPDIIIASPPCEEFSLANPTSKQSAAERIYSTGTARLVLDTIRLISDLSPSVYVIENVAAILQAGGKGILHREMRQAGIDEIVFNLVRAHRHGNPSKRLRVFISNLKLRLPRSPPPTVMATIGDLPSLGLHAILTPENNVPNHCINVVSDDKLKKIRKLKFGRGVRHFRGRSKKIIPNWVRLHPNRISTSIIGLSKYVHPYENRLLTVREHARLMSYPDSFEFLGHIDSQYNHVGESVPPLISRLIAEEVRKKIE